MKSMLTVIRFLILPLLTNSLFAEEPCATNQDGTCGAWSYEVVRNVKVYYPDCDVDVSFKTRICNGRVEYFITNIRVNEGCGGWDNVTYLHKSYSGFMDYVTQALMDAIWENSGAIPYCPSTDYQTVSVYSASCGIWVFCEYVLEANYERTCPDWQGPYPEFGVNPKMLRVYQWQSCGTACCKRVFSICRSTTTYQMNIKQLSKGRYSAECSGQANYSTPCQDGC